ncbi:carbohydrate-binding domain-containing protein [Candidatus Saccharibacteria bacterium]|nr:carbohydrate-binding domain-containing protein [Candidatus Saccharibacteria bacterium]
MNEQTKNPNTPPRNVKKLLPIILIILIPALLLVLGLLFFNKNSGNESLGNNIDDSAINWSSYEEKSIELSDSLKITTPGVYTLSGSIENGLIEINTTGVVKLILNGVSIKNSSGPAILVSEAKTVIIETAEGSENFLEDGSVYSISDEDVCATLFSKDDLVLQGSGTLSVVGNYEDAIVSKDDLKISSGTYKIDAKDEGIRGRDSLYVKSGTFDISAGGDGLKANNSDEVAKGYVLIDGGTFDISADDDGIHAESSLEINGGTINIKKSYEGLEGSKITINGGDISVIASDDGLNAAGGNDSSSPNMANYQSSSSNYSINLNGGKIYVNSLGDGIDSNGALYISGSEVVVDGPANSANGALDAEGEVVYSGGSIIALGASGMAVAPGSSSTKNSISVFFSQTSAAKTKLTVKDSSGTTLLEHTSTRSFGHAVLSSESFEQGKTYTIFLNDEEYTTVTISGTTTQSGQGGMMPGGGGGMAPGGQQGAPGGMRR